VLTTRTRHYSNTLDGGVDAMAARQRCVLVTGASRGLGLELCKQYAAAGWNVFAACREGADAASVRELISSSSADQGAIVPMQLDVCDAASVQALGTALDHGGVSIDILYNNAGVALGRSSAIASGPSFAYDDWELCLKTNVLGPTRVLEAVLPSLARGGGGGGGGGEEDRGGGGGGDRPFTVVNISSSLGSISRVNMGSAFSTSSMDMVYRSSKAALNMATVCAAAELQTSHPVGTGT